MPNAVCKVCGKGFYAKPVHVKNGWGKYCSRVCHYEDAHTGTELHCAECGSKIYRTPSVVAKSKSKKFFCTKSCQTVWRNQQFVGQKHANWRHGRKTYKTILTRLKVLAVCRLCKTKDKRVLAVHHIDHNHTNNVATNLAWLCHNCHYVVHHDNVVEREFMEALV